MTWPQGARVVEGGVVYRALTQTSQQPPHADWTPDVDSTLQPSVTGSITLNGTTNNTVVMTDIVPELGLETGDVIRIAAGAYNKLHTVESITDNSSIIVNYEHAGNRRNGSLKLPDFTGQATVTRIAKWFNAPIGIGQAWLEETGNRLEGTVYSNTTGKPIFVSITAGERDAYNKLFVDGVAAAFSYFDGTGAVYQTLQTIVPNGSEYYLEHTGEAGRLQSWSELR